ncbi:hypothetical protein FACS1894188_05490 [Clostridia bacterium]|nr:hypothetical protein FACS1894188_05490 [Clostridia bacterium]
MGDYTAKITLDGEEFDLLLSTEATKLIATKHGGLDNLGEKLLKLENMELALDEVCWLVATLANAPIKKHNFKEPNAQKPLLTAEAVGILSTPLELADYKDAIMVALTKGTKRTVESESDTKNAQAG